VPPNTSATLSVPCATGEVEIVEGVAGVISKKEPSAGRQEIEVGSGMYRMKSRYEEFGAGTFLSPCAGAKFRGLESPRSSEVQNKKCII
jgi:hypothetical protein